MTVIVCNGPPFVSWNLISSPGLISFFAIVLLTSFSEGARYVIGFFGFFDFFKINSFLFALI